MKVLIVNAQDYKGGAARAAMRLHLSLQQSEEISSEMIVQIKDSSRFDILGPNSKFSKAFNYVKPYADSISLRITKCYPDVPFSLGLYSYSSIVKKINSLDPDIVHLHWVCRGMLSIKDIAKIKAPIVWSLHDMWPFTGGCHYDNNCGRFKNRCGSCPILNSDREHDITQRVLLKKIKAFGSINNLTIVGLSKWLAQEAKESTVFRGVNVVNLPNPIDVTEFKPLPKKYCRDLWNLPQDKKLVLFGAMSATSDGRKGYTELIDAISAINDQNVEYVVFGANSSPQSPENMHFVGTLQDDQSLISLYNACDVFVLPSKQENLANTVMESISSGTPVVAFNIGGNSDMIAHKVNGYLATPFSSKDLADGIKWVLDADEVEIENCTRKSALKFSYENVSKKYEELYRTILNG
ncbi:MULTISPECIES: glycosyltransferase family 4 protein [Vibrio harveyi group]|uniref:glycosyltransferase family 4 protein n=1 Tax=Vibrio harveyi group TaxID=717610 RepID=UPI0010BCFA3D|nr:MULTISPECIES: glycosyltransferase family 4 protein [Vibrio harveyi group]MCE9843354.1 glycosyltransferase family 4 protein [Vibrio antiquarius]TKF09140.1 glycosyltransferase [Vibrio alginolyticus]